MSKPISESVTSLLVDPRVDDVLRRAAVAHLAMETGTGPHVTPELYAWSGGRLWIATARRTLKARRLAPGSRAGIFVAYGGRSVLLGLEARPLDALRPGTLFASAPEVGLSLAAGTMFVIRNAPHLVGFVAQGPAAWPRSASTLRTFVGLRPRAIALLENDRVVGAAGEWVLERPRGRRKTRPGAVRTDDLPEDLAPLAEEFVPDALVGLSSPSGPVALPAAWDGATATATVRTELLTLAAVTPDGPVAVEVERMRGYAMEGKTGVLLRGEGRISLGREVSEIVVEPERATYWQGLEVETVGADST